MKDRASVNSSTWLFVAALVSIPIMAVACARYRAHKLYLGWIAVLTAGGIVAGFAALPPHHSGGRAALLLALTYLPLAALYAVVPGSWVRRGATWKSTLAITGAASVLGVPAWFVYAIFISCSLGHDCL